MMTYGTGSNICDSALVRNGGPAFHLVLHWVHPQRGRVVYHPG